MNQLLYFFLFYRLHKLFCCKLHYHRLLHLKALRYSILEVLLLFYLKTSKLKL